MSDILGISSGAISAYQRALSTVSNNIANVNTEGYSRQDVVLKDSAPKKLASMYVGTGVMLQNIRRQYDEFAESNLRNSNSDLSAQTPMVDYTKRVMDIMGDKSIGLSSALDDFFNAAGSLSADPASTVLRTSFLRSAEGVSSRFGELSGQLKLIQAETRQGLESVASQINTLTSQLALINQSLARSPSLETQPAELLDRRDLALRNLADLVRSKISFAANGTVTVSLGSTMTQGVVVDGMNSRPVGIDRNIRDKVEFILDPYGKPESLPGLAGGTLGGYQTFIGQVLDPAIKNLNTLAGTFVQETNAVQGNGIDSYGQIGQDLYGIGNAQDQAASVTLKISDGLRVATAAQFRIIEGTANSTDTRATVRYNADPTPALALSNTALVNNPNASAGVAFKVEGARVYTPVTTLSAGVRATFFMDEAEPGQHLQVLTRDGRQLLGNELTETEKYQLLTPANGFAPNATYSSQYLNQSDDKAFRGLDLFYGAKAGVTYRQNYDANGVALTPIPMAAKLQTGPIGALTQPIAQGALALNGVDLANLPVVTQSQVILAGVSFGSAPLAPFKFKANIGGAQFRVPTFNNNSLASLAATLQQSLRSFDGNRTDISVELINNGADLLIQDAKGRDMTGVGFSKIDPTDDSSVGEVRVRTAAERVKQWLNGESTVTFENVAFGTQGQTGFSRFDFKLGGLPIAVTGLTSTTLPNLAKELQTRLRTLDQSAALSVVVENGKMILTDYKGRSISDVVLKPNSTTSGAGVAKIDVAQSVTTQSHVLAETSSTIRVPLRQLDFTKGLTLNGQQINGATNLAELVETITNADIGLQANIDESGELVISDPQGGSITVGSTGSTGNLLGVSAATYDAQVTMTQVARDLRVAATELDFNRNLQINGYDIVTRPGQVQDIAGLVDVINAQARTTGVVAAIDDNNDLRLSVLDAKGISNISIGPAKDALGSYTPNTLGLEPMDYDVTYRLKSILNSDIKDRTLTDIRLSFGDYPITGTELIGHGAPVDLSKIGLRTGAYMEGGCPDDLLLVVTGKGSAKIAVGFEGQPLDQRESLRAQSIEVRFTAPDRFKIIDSRTGTELADRHFDNTALEPVIAFQGLQLKLSQAPAVGDVFRIDGNQDGLGNNVNMLDMVELRKLEVANGKTLHDAYVDQVNNIGNLSQQAQITQEALQVVNDQAVASRDKVSGVNLDDEAAALVRYQQAYQAAAKALQISGQLFDAIAQIN